MEMNPLVRPGLIGAAALAARLAFAQQASAPAPGAGAGMGSEPVQNRGECAAFVDEHFTHVTARSRQRGLPGPASARPNVCNGLPK